jgi:hypothetical protein
MKFFFPDSQDQIDPAFDFLTEERPVFRVRQRDDCYAHEALDTAPFNGILVSKAIVDGTAQGSGKYTVAQRHRLYRQGVRSFFRLDSAQRPLLTMGDCGAFNYVREQKPPYLPDEVIDFYEDCGFDLGISVDHIVFGYRNEPLSAGGSKPAVPGGKPENYDDPQVQEWSDRQDTTLNLATEFLRRCNERKVSFTPMGVAQGWSPESYAFAVRQLQDLGFSRIAIGGMVPLKTHEILACLERIAVDRAPATQFHLLGISRCESISTFAAYGVTSFDSTSVFRQAFKDDKDNLYTLDRTYVALRVPQTDGNPKLKAQIKAGRVDQGRATDLEQACLAQLRSYDEGKARIDDVLETLRAYELLYDGRVDRTDSYRQTLEDRPWKSCDCGLCAKAGIDIAIFRGSERNKRRGFHNLHVFSRRLERELAPGSTA